MACNSCRSWKNIKRKRHFREKAKLGIVLLLIKTPLKFEKFEDVEKRKILEEKIDEVVSK